MATREEIRCKCSKCGESNEDPDHVCDPKVKKIYQQPWRYGK